MNISGVEDTRYMRERGGFKLIQKDCSLNWAILGLLSRELSRLFTFPAHPPPPYWKECF